ncbi:hypothetical protein [Pseudomonas anguilliseptica]|uniref:hypothetical protein n=1 Tax=Pseudomonas anguilliseptica TaxID=53406 RepID=UPI0022AE9547|nr:hypothetical protein [Pseudomonas anguilliseptica]MCZ4323044.1 hypothetical protein [Pseudomonas anguilliseptica]
MSVHGFRGLYWFVDGFLAVISDFIAKERFFFGAFCSVFSRLLSWGGCVAFGCCVGITEGNSFGALV